MFDEADDTWHVRRVAGRSHDDEFAGTLAADLRMLQVALVAIAGFTYVAISNCQDGFVGSRFLITVGGACRETYGLPGAHC